MGEVIDMSKNVINLSKNDNDKRETLAQMLKCIATGDLPSDPEDRKEFMSHFCELVLFENPYVDVNYPKVKTLITPMEEEDILGGYHRFFNWIQVSDELIDDILENRQSIFMLFNVLGHEYTHAIQHAGKSYMTFEQYNSFDEDTKNKLTVMFDDLNSLKISDENINAIYGILKYRLGDEGSFLEGLSDESRNEIFKKIIFDIYFKSEHERIAREQGMGFSAYMYDCLINDPSVDEEVKQWLKRQKTFINEQRKLYDDVYKMDNKHLTVLTEYVGKMNLQDFSKISKKFYEIAQELRDGGKFGDKDQIDLEIIAKEAYKYLFHMWCRGKSSDELLNLVMSEMAIGHGLEIQTLIDNINKKIDYKMGEDDVYLPHSVKIENILINGDLPQDSFKVNYVEVLGPETQNNVIEELFKRGKLASAFNMAGAYVKYFKTVGFGRVPKDLLFNESWTEIAIDFMKKAQSGEKLPKMEVRAFKSFVYTMSRDVDENSPWHKMLEESEKIEYQFMSKAEAYDYLDAVYGPETAARECPPQMTVEELRKFLSGEETDKSEKW